MTKYILMVIAGAISFGILSSFVKLAYDQGYHAGEISFIQAALGAIVLWLLSISSGKQSATAKDIPMLLMSGFSLGITTYLYYLSVKYIPASIAIVLLMQFTWVSILLEWLIFRRKPQRLELVITVVILIGTALASGLTEQGQLTLSVKGIVLVLSASFAYAVYIVANSRVGKHLPWQNKSAWIITGSAITILIINFNAIVFENHFGGELVKWGVFLALFGTILPPVLFAIGIPKVGASMSGLLMTIELPIAVVSAYLILKEHLVGIQIIGIAVMITAIVCMNILKQRSRHYIADKSKE